MIANQLYRHANASEVSAPRAATHLLVARQDAKPIKNTDASRGKCQPNKNSDHSLIDRHDRHPVFAGPEARWPLLAQCRKLISHLPVTEKLILGRGGELLQQVN